MKRDVLRARARALAHQPEHEEAEANFLQVVEFVLSDERYGIPITYVREVYPFKEITPIPCAPVFVLGMINIRGKILTVIDPRAFFDRPKLPVGPLSKVVVIHVDDVEVGLIADTVVGVRAVEIDEIQPHLPTMTGLRAKYLKGLASNHLAILDIPSILSDPSLTVNEEVE